jgi:8-oxo-dGTP pyrophosphatase MutT (NUDIX family)
MCYEIGVIREAASIILLRQVEPADVRTNESPFELFLLRRHRGSSFMASAYVFPGGATEPGEDARTAGVRELFEEAGVLFAKQKLRDEIDTLDLGGTTQLRERILGGAPAAEALDLAGLQWATEALVPWSHWITPSIETKRFSARFFVAELPGAQEPQFDSTETVDQLWVTPQEALAHAAELQLPPPQVRTCWELAQHKSMRAVFAAGRQRAEEPHPIMPRLAPGERPCLLLPWDPEYLTKGTGESTPLTYNPRWAAGPSRFVLEDRAWKHVAAPGSTVTA